MSLPVPTPAALADACAVRTVHREQVEDTRARIPTAETAARLAARFRMLADPGRVRLIFALLEAGELCVCDLAAIVGASESATSHQLRRLRAHGLVTFRKAGRIAYYRLTDAHVRLLLDLAAEHDRHGAS